LHFDVWFEDLTRLYGACFLQMWNEIFSTHSWRSTIQVCDTCMNKAIITRNESRRLLLYKDVVLQRRRLYFQLNKF